MEKIAYAIIPARKGSKGVANKNIRLFCGFPLIAWSIAAARLAGNVSRVLVSTDSDEYATLAKKYGAEVPFLRPTSISGDRAQDLGFIMHALLWLEENELYIPDYLVHLRPTIPVRNPMVIDQAILKMRENTLATSLCSAHEASKPLCKYFNMDREGYFHGILGESLVSLPRQDCSKAYESNGYVDVLVAKEVLATGSLYGNRRLSLVTSASVDIDTENDFLRAEILVEHSRPAQKILDYLKGI